MDFSALFDPLVVKAGLTCLAAQVLLYVLFWSVLPTGPWTQKPGFTAHQVVCLPLMIYVSYAGFLAWFFESPPVEEGLSFADTEGRMFNLSPGGRDLGRVILGSMIFWDVPVGLITPSLHDSLMMGHHIAMIFVSAIPAGVFSNGYSVASYYASFFFGVIELSTVFLCFVDFFHPKHKAWFDFLQNTKGPLGNFLRAFNEICRVAFALLFTALRSIYFPYVMFAGCLGDFWSAAMLPEDQRHGIAAWPLLGTCVLCFFFSFLQMYWGVLVLKGIAKAVGLMPSNSPQDAKED